MTKEHAFSSERLLFEGECFTLFADKLVQSDGARAELRENSHVHVSTPRHTTHWRVNMENEAAIQYSGDIPVLSMAYNLALEELNKSRREGGLLSTGHDWSTIWTRDTSYATHLSLGVALPDECMKTLEHKITVNGEIEQDTGTGGSWPISSDRVVWGLAAWEIYLMTGQRDWLESSCRILEETCIHDTEVLVDMSGLLRGETSFLDWRKQSYPCWMTPSDIGESAGLSTMLLHRHARKILSGMYAELGKPERSLYWKEQGDRVEKTIEELFWMPYHGLYGQYLYGRGYPVLSEKSDTLGECLSVLFDVAKDRRAANIVAAMPRCPLGVPCFFPMRSVSADLPPYHNESMWPFIESYYVLAASRVGNEDAVLAGIASLVRTALICGTNKENVYIKTGYPDEMAMSSDSQLWSIAGMLGAFYKGLFGLRPGIKGISFAPCVPHALIGSHRLTGVKYRNMTFDISLSGSGSKVGMCRINGEEAKAFLSADLEGHYFVELELEADPNASHQVNWQPVKYNLAMPKWDCSGTDLSWMSVQDADYYRVYRNGVPVAQTEATCYVPMLHSNLSHYQIMAVSLDGRESYLNEPREHVPCDCRIETRPCGLKGDDVWISRLDDSDRAAFHDITISKAGVYRVDAYYANGTGSLRDGNTCALRSLMLNGGRAGSLAFPHLTEEGQWDEFNYSPGIEVALPVGIYKIELIYQTYDENINHFVNDALIKTLRFTRISE